MSGNLNRMDVDVQQLLETCSLSAGEISTKTREVYDTVLAESCYLDSGNFTAIHPDDLRRMFDQYDLRFFEQNCRRLLGDAPLDFRLSKRMTQAAGKTERKRLRHSSGYILETRYQIVLSSTILYETFRDEGRAATVNGIECHDRLEAAQRVMEHELIHLLEMLVWGSSSCSAGRFQSIAQRFFGHTEHAHRLTTPRQRAFEEFGIRAGDFVSFRYEGQHHEGIVNRITKRATVLVEDARGEPYSNGKCYLKFYVPIRMLNRMTQ